MHRRAVVAAVVAIATVLIAHPVRAATRIVLTPPVEAPILDPFRPPATPYGPGNRGIEYATEPGAPARAAAAGVVVFAGAVARTIHVTIDHGGGLLSSYSFLDRELVSVGDPVSRGDRVGITGRTLHFGVRIHGEYVDPASLMGIRSVEVRLVPKRDIRALATVRSGLGIPEPLAPARSVGAIGAVRGDGHPLHIG